jgi:hypothetical protein
VSKIRLLTATMTHGASSTAEVEYTPDKLAKAIASLLIAGFQEDTIEDENLHLIGAELSEVGKALGEKLNMDAKYDRIPAESAERIREALGLLYISQLAQGQAFGLLSSDPVVSLAMSQTWNQLHVDMPVDDELSAEQHARYQALCGPNEEGDFPEMVAVDMVNNWNSTGCICGHDHGKADRPVGELSSEELLATIPNELRPVLAMLTGATGKTEVEIAEYLRDSFLSGEAPGVAMQRLLADSLGKVSGPFNGTVEPVDPSKDPVEQLFQQAKSQLPPLRPDQEAALRAQLEDQREEISATSKDGGVHALRIKLPK